MGDSISRIFWSGNTWRSDIIQPQEKIIHVYNNLASFSAEFLLVEVEELFRLNWGRVAIPKAYA